MKKASHWILVAFGLVWIAAVTIGYIRASATADWPSVVGVVLAQDYKESLLGFYRETTGADGSKGPKFKVPMSYAYQVDGRQFEGKAFRVNAVGRRVLMSGTRTWLRDQLLVGHVYRPGNAVTVYYDPGDPGRAVLEKGYRGGSPLFLIVIGLGIAAFGLVQVFQGSGTQPS